MERTPIWNELHLRMKTFKTYIDFPFYRIRKGAASDRLARKACAGTRPNENSFMLLVLTQLRKAPSSMVLHRSAWSVSFRAEFDAYWIPDSQCPEANSRAHCCACQ